MCKMERCPKLGPMGRNEIVTPPEGHSTVVSQGRLDWPTGYDGMVSLVLGGIVNGGMAFERDT